MIFLVPVVLALWGLTSNRDGLVMLGIAIFVWLSWSRQKTARRSRLWSVPMPTVAKVPEFGGGTPDADDGGSCGCA